MTAAPEKIKDVLEEQIKEYKNLLALLRKERQSLIDIDQEGVADLSKQKDTAVLKLRLLEGERLRLVSEYFTANEGGSGGENISLQELSRTTGDGSFLEIRRRIISLLQGIQELNEFNRILIERSLHFVSDSLDFLGKSGATVNASGPRAKGLVVSRQV